MAMAELLALGIEGLAKAVLSTNDAASLFLDTYQAGSNSVQSAELSID